ncbi:hypothetical protein NA57DRAFT_73791 [Rhizodiscina lignyota]|uniref:DUF7703 domain-containing protein n=1 Tax=Rhizodiscina lignyota TaxID=1504668 RepID=A0A9P4IJ09_9PEZI|nr:hypothetical protein NA57DRAFT_73791 [Rhizodiscina lignyota]
MYQQTEIFPRDASTNTGNFGKNYPHNRQLLILGGFIGIAWMCQFQVIVIGYTTFKRYSGLYFWSICSATVSLIIYTLGVLLYDFILGDTHAWIPSVLITAGYLIFIPSEYLFIFSRLHLLQPSRRMANFVKWMLLSEYLLIEIPATTLYLVVANTPYNPLLGDVVQVYVGISVVLLSAVLMIVSSLYLYLAWKLFGLNASPEVKRIFVSLFAGTTFIFILYCINIIIWFIKKAVIRGCWLPFEFSCTLIVEFWILNHLSQLATSTSRDLQSYGYVPIISLQIASSSFGH